MRKKTERIVLTDDQLKVMAGLGVDLKGKELEVGLLAGRLPVIREHGQGYAEDIIICVTGC